MSNQGDTNRSEPKSIDLNVNQDVVIGKPKVPKEEKKTYINLICCSCSLGIILALCYCFTAVLLNVVNRVVFYNYHFKFNFTFMFLQQIFCIVFFFIVSRKSQIFKKQAGEISIKDFLQLKWYYISFASIFILNNLTCFYGTQLIVNAAMFQTLRKLALVMLYFTDIVTGKTKGQLFPGICVFLITFGGILSGIDSFSKDYFGIAITMITNTIWVIYNKFTEIFKKKTGVSNLKLLVYNSYLSGPTLFILIFVSGEFKKLYNFIDNEGYKDEGGNGSFLGMAFFTAISCTFVIVLNSTFFMSNEKNSSTFTALLGNSKDILTSVLSFMFLKGNKPTVKIVLGLLISTVGAFMFSTKSIFDNTKKIDKGGNLQTVNIKLNSSFGDEGGNNKNVQIK